MTQITDIQELRDIQMGILDEIHRFCTSRDIRYFLSSGSLLGAVRHGGYIPWDDDLDIYMPRTDYERFLDEWDCGVRNGDDDEAYEVINPATAEHYFYTFAKVVDTRTLMVEKATEGYEIGVYVDVFPVDYVPDDEAERERVFKRKKLLYKIRQCKLSRHCCLKSRVAYWCYKHLPLSLSRLNKMIEELVVRREPTGWMCNMTEAGPGVKSCLPAELLSDWVDIRFEDRTYKTMVGFKEYLTLTYGDYMTLPPVEQRQTHHFEAYRK